MTINNKDIYMSKLWDWGFLDNCFGGTKIKVTDLDGIIERNGRFLMLEAKSPGKEIPTGQRIMFDRVSKDKNWQVLIIWGNAPDSPIEHMIWGQPKQSSNQDTVKQVVERWFREAEGKQ